MSASTKSPRERNRKPARTILACSNCRKRKIRVCCPRLSDSPLIIAPLRSVLNFRATSDKSMRAVYPEAPHLRLCGRPRKRGQLKLSQPEPQNLCAGYPGTTAALRACRIPNASHCSQFFGRIGPCGASSSSDEPTIDPFTSKPGHSSGRIS
jgi:hypothetical protein